jgi:hypothetical protein
VVLPCYSLRAAGCLIAAVLFALRPYLAAMGTNGVFMFTGNGKRRGIPREKSWLTRFAQSALSLCFVIAVCVTGAIAVDFAENYFFPLTLMALFALADLAALFFGTARFAWENSKFTVTPRFSPVPLRAASSRKRIAPSALIFLAAGVVSVIAAKLPLPGNSEAGIADAPIILTKKPGNIEGLSYKDYEAHYRFQQNFAFTRLKGKNSDETPPMAGGYFHYTTGSDGLIVPASSGNDASGDGTPPATYTLPLLLTNGSE